MRKSKYVILLGDGMPDRPSSEKGGATPLMAARTPNLDKLAGNGSVGSVTTTPAGFLPGSDVTNMSILGYDPARYYTGRAPLEATAMGVRLGPDDVAFRCNLVCLQAVPDGVMMDDFSAGHIETRDAGELVTSLNEEMAGHEVSFYPGVSYRHLMVWKDGKDGAKLTPPHDISGRNIRDYMPQGAGADFLKWLTGSAQIFLKNHAVNRRRADEGKKAANSIWLWGQGKAPRLPQFVERSGLSGAMISAVDLMRGIALNAGMKVINVPGATGWIDTDYQGKASACLEALKDTDLVYLHVESPDEAGHCGSWDNKVKAIEDFDAKVVGPVVEGLEALGDFRVMALSDHPTPLDIMTHSLDPVPFAIYPALDDTAGGVEKFDESIIDISDVKLGSGVELFDYFVEGGKS